MISKMEVLLSKITNVLENILSESQKEIVENLRKFYVERKQQKEYLLKRLIRTN